jgi:hypothetical protein
VEKESKLHFILAFVWRHVVVLCMRETLHDPVLCVEQGSFCYRRCCDQTHQQKTSASKIKIRSTELSMKLKMLVEERRLEESNLLLLFTQLSTMFMESQVVNSMLQIKV